MATITLPTVYLNFEINLASPMAANASSFTLNSGVDDDGTTLSGRYYLVIDEGLSTEEHFIATLAGTAGTVVTNGISRVDGTTSVSANRKAHDKGATVKITNSVLLHLVRLLNGIDTFNAVNLLGINSITGLATPTAGETTKAANVDYVNNTASAGASDSTTTVKGIVEKATSAETQAGTDTGGTTAPLFAAPSDIAKNIQDSKHTYAADAGSTDSYAITLSPAITAYATGQVFTFYANTANTGGATLNVNAKGAKTIKKLHDQDLEDGDIEAGSIVQVVYDGTNFQLLTPQATIPTTAVLSEMSTFFGTTDITGVQAEELTDGSTTSLHFHNISIHEGQRLNADGSGTETIAVGFVPKYCIIEWGCDGVKNNSVEYNLLGWGKSNGTLNYTLYQMHPVVAQGVNSDKNTSYCVYAYMGITNVARSWRGTITFNTTNVEINWTMHTDGATATAVKYILTVFG